jgi:inner membrane protein
MPTIFTHAAIGFVAAKVSAEVTGPNPRIVVAAMALAALPDADALFISVVPYSSPLGHRGLTHSLAFAAMAGVLVAALFSKAGWAKPHSFGSLAMLFVLVTASHGFFDAMTDGGLGIAFFAPFNNARYFLPWRPIPVAPLTLEGLMTPRGLRVIGWEAGLFWTFTLGALIWERNTMLRKILSGVCALVGIAMWVIALIERG